MRLTDLMPEWVNSAGGNAFRRFSDSHSHVDYGEGQEWADPPFSSEDVTAAHGILFLCPTCFKKNGGPVGTESVLVWFASRPVPPEAKPTPRWGAAGSGFSDLSLSPSINVAEGHWHGFITNGEIK